MSEGPLVFDLDGTLIDARQRQVGVAAEVAAELCRFRLDGDRFWRAKRSGATTAAALVTLGQDEASAQMLAREWMNRIESDRWLDQDTVLPGVMTVLRRLRTRAEILVLTARTRPDGARRSIEVTGLAPLIDDVVVVDPAAAVVGKTSSLRRCRARAFVGDTESDGAASASAEVPFVAVTTGQRSRRYMTDRGYDPARSLSAAMRRLGVV